MGAVVFALMVLMLLWAAACLPAVRALAGRSAFALQSAWLAVAVMVGAGLLIALVMFVLPGSMLSRGWTQELLESAQQRAILLVMVAAVAGFLRAQSRLTPLVSAPPARPALPAQQKRRS